MIFSAIASILGSPSVINKGMELIDDAFESDEERRESKTNAKIALLGAYAPFKLAQRYIALMFGFMFVTSFLLVLTMTLLEMGNPDDVIKVVEQFKVGWVMTTIVLFYFGGGMVESIGNTKKKGTE